MGACLAVLPVSVKVKNAGSPYSMMRSRGAVEPPHGRALSVYTTVACRL